MEGVPRGNCRERERHEATLSPWSYGFSTPNDVIKPFWLGFYVKELIYLIGKQRNFINSVKAALSIHQVYKKYTKTEKERRKKKKRRKEKKEKRKKTCKTQK
jgi:hypothetical protein